MSRRWSAASDTRSRAVKWPRREPISSATTRRGSVFRMPAESSASRSRLVSVWLSGIAADDTESQLPLRGQAAPRGRKPSGRSRTKGQDDGDEGDNDADRVGHAPDADRMNHEQLEI